MSAQPRYFLRRAFAFIVLIFLTFCAKGFAQGGASGAVQGDVRDSSGALIAGAEVTLTGSGRGIVRVVRTNSEGSFAATLLPPGNYRVEVRATGFAPVVAEDVQVRVSETIRLSLALKPGAVATEVSVDARVAAVNTSDASTGEAIGSGTIENLPLATRNFQQLLTLSTGTAASLNQNASLGRGDVRIDVNGQREDNNNYLIDGITATDYNVAELTNTPLPSPDAIGEFRVQTSLYDSTQGRNGGGNINAILKTGTLQFHAPPSNSCAIPCLMPTSGFSSPQANPGRL